MLSLRSPRPLLPGVCVGAAGGAWGRPGSRGVACRAEVGAHMPEHDRPLDAYRPGERSRRALNCLVGWMAGCLVGWWAGGLLVGGWAGRLVGASEFGRWVGGLACCLVVAGLVSWLARWWVGGWAGGLVGWSVGGCGRLGGWVVGWWVGWLLGWLGCGLAGWLGVGGWVGRRGVAWLDCSLARFLRVDLRSPGSVAVCSVSWFLASLVVSGSVCWLVGRLLRSLAGLFPDTSLRGLLEFLMPRHLRPPWRGQ